MGYIFKNENPYGKMVDDCVIRAIATATGQSWDRTAHDLFEEQLAQKDLQNSNTVWGQVPFMCTCSNVSIRNISTQPITVANANIVFDKSQQR